MCFSRKLTTVLATCLVQQLCWAIDDLNVSVRDLSNETNYLWTPERLATAKPMPLPVVIGESDGSKEEKKNDRRRRQAEDDWARVKPAPMPSVKLSDMEALGIQPGTKLLARGLWGTNNNEVETADVTQPPFNAMGKLVFEDSEGEAYECTAQYIAPQIVLTAAHCVYSVDSSPRSWNQHFRFYQQYEKKRLGKTSGTPRKVRKAVVSNKWINGRRDSFAYDFAMLVMDEPTVAGHMEVGFPDDYEKWTAAGYPKNYAQGKILQKYQGEKGRMTRTVVETIGDPMGPGCSGGAWLVDSGGKTYVIGLNSFSIDGITSMFSPRFTQEHIDTVMSRTLAELAKGRQNRQNPPVNSE